MGLETKTWIAALKPRYEGEDMEKEGEIGRLTIRCSVPSKLNTGVPPEGERRP